MAFSSKIRVGVIRGGPSSEHDISLKTGAYVLKNLPDSYYPVDIFIDKVGVWHVQGLQTVVPKALKKVDVVFNCSHGEYGEDGSLQRLLQDFGMPYSGSRQLASLFSMHKGHAKNFLKKHGIKSPYHKLLKKERWLGQNHRELWRAVSNPSIVKPVALGSSLGIALAKNFLEFENALEMAFKHSSTVMIEEYINGREATCGVIDAFRGEEIYTLLPTELVLPQSSIFLDYGAKYGGKMRAIHPGRFSEMEKYEIQNMARKVHQALGLRHYSRSDFIVSQKRGIYFLEVNALPYLGHGSPYTEALSAVGFSFPQFLDHILKLAIQER